MGEEIPKQVKEFVEAATANAKEAWGEDNIIAKDVMFAERGEDGSWTVSDNYERFFSTIYRFDPKSGAWTIRTMYAGEPEKPYTFEKVMADASILFTG